MFWPVQVRPGQNGTFVSMSTGGLAQPDVSPCTSAQVAAVFAAEQQELQEDGELRRRGGATRPRVQREGGHVSEGGGGMRRGSTADCHDTVSSDTGWPSKSRTQRSDTPSRNCVIFCVQEP